ncbi:hypothetical protein [Sporosarcina cyprini]|uniref:hypothetical protein n=1 Tax=Sporosarcina cyprini TaxID=2910523 RepID=UPI001EE0EBB1|nr:hypothetical protein [Sporosarcina cyprini]MCG3089121.1 hypothetical protein [Sporosarcina cyprini]
MQKTPKLGLNKPELTEYVTIADLNENMDILDGAVGELKEGTTVIPELQTANKTLAGAINEVKTALTKHLEDPTPNQFIGADNKKYEYGFKTNATNDGLIFVFNEVIV